MTKMLLSDIKLDKKIYPRKTVSELNVGRLVAALSCGTKLPPVTVDANSNRLVDGWHRHAAYSKVGADEIPVVKKTYATEADLFADAVRLNSSHGEPLDSYSIQNAIIKLEKYGYTREQISLVIHRSVPKIEKIERGFASNEKGEPVAVKGGLSHLAGAVLSDEQIKFNQDYGGTKALFYVRQLAQMLEANACPDTASFRDGMDRVVALWTARASKAA
jgi:hypothetical protein